MTKDVLVSVRGTQFIGGSDDDSIEIITSGSYYNKDGRHYIIYEESVEGVDTPTRNVIKVTPDKIEVAKRGIVESHMTFECGKKNMANYVTPMGLIVLGLTTTSMQAEEQEDSFHIRIEYSLEMNGEYVSGCCLDLLARSRKEVALHLNS